MLREVRLGVEVEVGEEEERLAVVEAEDEQAQLAQKSARGEGVLHEVGVKELQLRSPELQREPGLEILFALFFGGVLGGEKEGEEKGGGGGGEEGEEEGGEG